MLFGYQKEELIEQLVNDSLGVNHQNRFLDVKRWIQKQPLVIAGYFDDVKGVNLVHLIGLWLDGDFAEYYPYAADHFQILVVDEDDDRSLKKLLKDFRYCHYLKIWVRGEEISALEIKEFLEVV
ncbi:hypothetical protein WKK05_38085 (plasmid) [Nostoc sp. UHCC 0302]|uniref:hypothetical protein n=1 Tax=Nostoc sp. UHCC 0302 TaxID=3134896 RepID=UPI00311CCDAA